MAGTVKIVEFDSSDMVLASTGLTSLAPTTASIIVNWSAGGRQYVASIQPGL